MVYSAALLVAIAAVLGVSYSSPYCLTPLRTFLIGELVYLTVFVAFSVWMLSRGKRIAAINLDDPETFMYGRPGAIVW